MGHRLSILIPAVLVATSACGTSPVAPAPATSPHAGAVPVPVPSVTLSTLAGEHTELARLAGGRVALVSLWATWCESCAKEMDALNRLDAKTAAGKDAVVIGVDVGEERATVAEFARRRGLRYAQLVDEDFAFADALGQRRVPSTLVVDRQGRIVFRGDALDARSLEAFRQAIASEPAPPAAAREGDELLGTPAHAWNVEHWMNSAPLQLSDLRGRVVLVRWFMSTECPLCSATAPSLRAFDAEYRARGLSVVGMYHHKDPEPLDPAKVEKYVRTYGYTFPVAIDPDWRTLKDWWLDGHDRHYTSVSFLIDKRGTVRFIHPGGKYEPGSDDEKQLRAQIERLLVE